LDFSVISYILPDYKIEFDCMRLVMLVGRLCLPKLVRGNTNILMLADTKLKDIH